MVRYRTQENCRVRHRKMYVESIMVTDTSTHKPFRILMCFGARSGGEVPTAGTGGDRLVAGVGGWSGVLV
ncbi:putative pollen-specific leucine-rich repeat extensin-like protein 3 [Iris pallida]|uniref:Pollen-specific leucine-rich repeat extensin-like protein 3 n=1 Tax=Iris pallida TaxID=29817 RepID=A0AAX6GFK1_IRIPA|nr:putative pollen-specific leucine-rich repeat extensin-like protein 3 [Iris pallida]